MVHKLTAHVSLKNKRSLILRNYEFYRTVIKILVPEILLRITIFRIFMFNRWVVVSANRTKHRKKIFPLKNLQRGAKILKKVYLFTKDGRYSFEEEKRRDFKFFYHNFFHASLRIRWKLKTKKNSSETTVEAIISQWLLSEEFTRKLSLLIATYKEQLRFKI